MDRIEHYARVMVEAGLYDGRAFHAAARKGDLLFHLRTVFRGIDLERKKVLDVGGGAGRYSFYAACSGAEEVVCLEPESEGSSSRVNEKFREVQRVLGCANVGLETATFQDYEPGGKSFDVVLLHNSINHLDENACIHLLEDERSEAVYRGLLSKLGALSSRGARLVICDCARRNFLALLGVRNPLAPDIEWHKHQAPEVWAGLLRDAGFSRPEIRWSSLYQLRRAGGLLLANRLAAFFLQSHFCLTMTKT